MQNKTKAVDYEIKHFKNPHEWEVWLHANHQRVPGVWLQFYKKNTGVASLVYSEALDIALCYGWIDSQAKKYDEQSYLQKFTPRRNKSIWSKVNTQKVTQLIKDGRMQPAGLAQITAAKLDGRWEQAYDSPVDAKLPDDLLRALRNDKKTYDFALSLSKTNVYAIAWRLQTAKKPETRQKRLLMILSMLQNRETFH